MTKIGPKYEGGLVARGEQFELRRGEETFTGEVLWSWQDRDEAGAPLDPPKRVYPISILIDSIRGKSASGRRLQLSPSDKREIAEALRKLLIAREPDMQVEVFTKREGPTQRS